MSQLFDTTVLIAHLRGVRSATDLVGPAAFQGVAIASVLSRVEIEGGMRSHERAQVARLFGSLRMVPVSDGIASRAGQFFREYRRSHGAIGIVDHVIAATALELGAELLTLNVRHFPMFEDLQPAF